MNSNLATLNNPSVSRVLDHVISSKLIDYPVQRFKMQLCIVGSRLLALSSEDRQGQARG